jgi:hypothetical protein
MGGERPAKLWADIAAPARERSMARGADVVVKRFPSLRDEIEVCFGTSPEFRTLCLDLVAAYAALDHWMGVDTREAAARSEEYRALIASLEAEALQLVAGRAVIPPKAS